MHHLRTIGVATRTGNHGLWVLQFTGKGFLGKKLSKLFVVNLIVALYNVCCIQLGLSQGTILVCIIPKNHGNSCFPGDQCNCQNSNNPFVTIYAQDFWLLEIKTTQLLSPEASHGPGHSPGFVASPEMYSPFHTPMHIPTHTHPYPLSYPHTPTLIHTPTQLVRSIVLVGSSSQPWANWPLRPPQWGWLKKATQKVQQVSNNG